MCQDILEYADDNNLYLAFSYSDASSAVHSVETCISDIKSWMTINKLQLNDSKTEILLIRSKFHTVPEPVHHLMIGSSSVPVVDTARNIGVTFDKFHMFNHHIKNTCNAIYHHLRRIRSIRKYLKKNTCHTLIHAVLSTKLDYDILYSLDFPTTPSLFSNVLRTLLPE